MSPLAVLLRKWISFDGPVPEDVRCRCQFHFDDGRLTQEEYRVLLETPIGTIPFNAPGGAC